MPNELKLNRSQVRGGVYGDLGNKEQNNYAVYEIFNREDFDFFHMHITEDIEIHVGGDIFLFQLKQNQSTPSSIAGSIRKYFKHDGFMKFIINNKDQIKQWFWVSDVNASVKKADVFALISPADQFNSDGQKIANEATVREFINIFKAKFLFKGAGWLRNVMSSNEKIKSKINAKKFWVPGYKKIIIKNSIDFLTEQEELLRDRMKSDPSETYESFEELRAKLMGFSKKEIVAIIKSKKSRKIPNQRSYNKILSSYGPLKTDIYIRDADKEYAKEKILNCGVSGEEALQIRKEKYGY